MTETGICTNVLLAELHVQAGASCNDALLIYVIVYMWMRPSLTSHIEIWFGKIKKNSF